MNEQIKITTSNNLPENAVTIEDVEAFLRLSLYNHKGPAEQLRFLFRAFEAILEVRKLGPVEEIYKQNHI